MKKMLTLLLALCLCLGAFAAPASAQESLSGTLEFWHYWSADSEFENVDLVVEKFNEIYPDVEVVVTSFSRDELMKLYTMGAVSGELLDIAMMDNPEMNAFIKMGLCADITDYVTAWDQTSHYYEGPMLSCMDEGRYYGLPHNSNCLELFYDVDMLEGAGCTPPTTWSELMDVCAKLKETYPNVYPIGFSANNNEEGTFQFAPFMLSAGGSFEQLDSEGAIEAAALWKDMIDLGYAPKDVMSWGQTEVNTQFASGNLAMQVNGPWNISGLRADVPDKNWNVTLIPKADDGVYASVLGGENLAITSACENMDLAWAFLSFMCNGENTAIFCANVGKFAPRDDGNEYTDFWTSDPISAVFAEGMQYALPRGPHPRWSEFSAVVSNAVQEVLTGTKTPEQAMTDAQAAGSAIMG